MIGGVIDKPALLKLIGKNICRIRVDQGMTQPALAALAGVSKSSLWKIENGDSDAQVSTLDKIAAALEVDLRHLLFKDLP